MRKASIVTFTPDFSFSLLVRTRNASRSVMSASSWLVTCGISTQLRCKLAPLIFLMRERSLRSTGPNLAKSTCGHGSRPGNAPDAAPPGALVFADCALVCAAPDMTALTNPCTSSCVMRPLGPPPLTSVNGTPSSRASLRIVGEACGSAPAGAAGSCIGNAAVGTCFSLVPGDIDASCDEGGGSAAAVVTAAGTAAEAATGSVPVAPSSVAIDDPLETLSPTFTVSAMTTPACEDGISIDALSLSTVIRLCSALTVSPGLTSSSITATSAKSPMSGTTTSIGPTLAADAAAGD